MKWLSLLLIVSLLSCGDGQPKPDREPGALNPERNNKKQEKKKEELPEQTSALKKPFTYNGIAGDWLVGYSSYEEDDSKGEELYDKIQDSIITNQGLQLVRFAPDGNFYRTDMKGVKGRWQLVNGNKLKIDKGGKGFNSFTGDNVSYDKDEEELLMMENVRYKNSTVKVTWHFMPLTAGKDTIADLFSDDMNRWRIKPSAPESEAAIKERLAASLTYHSKYYMMIADRTNYFLSDRIILPFEFYQHAMGLNPFDPKSEFAGLFYDRKQAELAHGYIKSAMDGIDGHYPADDENFVIGYAHFMRQMAAYLRGEKNWK
ncbi:MAG TPA: hypothetical protein VHM26_18480 [Chitinophagaceae bacterium]|nr:hypothetical protein [Chitinophagaceae bacterium]